MNVQTVLGMVGGAVALTTLIVGLYEYRRQGAQKRVEYLMEMRKRLAENVAFSHICALLEDEAPELQKVSYKDRRNFLGFFEEVALMVNSGLLKAEVAHYMFGYYALRAWESEQFWQGINRGSLYWAQFRSFVSEMKRIESLPSRDNIVLRV